MTVVVSTVDSGILGFWDSGCVYERYDDVNLGKAPSRIQENTVYTYLLVRGKVASIALCTLPIYYCNLYSLLPFLLPPSSFLLPFFLLLQFSVSFIALIKMSDLQPSTIERWKGTGQSDDPNNLGGSSQVPVSDSHVSHTASSGMMITI